MKKGLFVAISGPSGVGKGTIINMLKERFKEAVYVLSNTTREKRPGEVDGQQYYFISEQEFQQGINEGKFLEWAKVHQGAYYGVLKAPVLQAMSEGKIVIREVDVQGYRLIRQSLPADQLVSIFILPETFEVLKTHILGRSQISDEELERRLASARTEMQAVGEFAHQVVNPEGQIEKGFAGVMSIIFDEAEKRGLLDAATRKA